LEDEGEKPALSEAEGSQYLVNAKEVAAELCCVRNGSLDLPHQFKECLFPPFRHMKATVVFQIDEVSLMHESVHFP